MHAPEEIEVCGESTRSFVNSARSVVTRSHAQKIAASPQSRLIKAIIGDVYDYAQQEILGIPGRVANAVIAFLASPLRLSKRKKLKKR